MDKDKTVSKAKSPLLEDGDPRLRDLPPEEFVFQIMEDCVTVARRGAAAKGPGAVVVNRRDETQYHIGYRALTQMDEDSPLARKVRELVYEVVPNWQELGIVVVILDDGNATALTVLPRWSLLNKDRGFGKTARTA